MNKHKQTLRARMIVRNDVSCSLQNKPIIIIIIIIIMHEEKPPDTDRETESRLSLRMTSNKAYHFQSTANHYRFLTMYGDA